MSDIVKSDCPICRYDETFNDFILIQTVGFTVCSGDI